MQLIEQSNNHFEFNVYYIKSYNNYSTYIY